MVQWNPEQEREESGDSGEEERPAPAEAEGDDRDGRRGDHRSDVRGRIEDRRGERRLERRKPHCYRCEVRMEVAGVGLVVARNRRAQTSHRTRLTLLPPAPIRATRGRRGTRTGRAIPASW